MLAPLAGAFGPMLWAYSGELPSHLVQGWRGLSGGSRVEQWCPPLRTDARRSPVRV